MNPYRHAFYQNQAEWHGYRSVESVAQLHETRAAYYEWYTRGWMPADKSARVLDIGCGSGQFLYFLRKSGYTHCEGIDLDKIQIQIGKDLGLNVHESAAFEYLSEANGQYDVIAMLDIIEHFTREELFPLLELVVRCLKPGGSLISSVPNATSPNGLQCVYADITHEIAFTPTSMKELMFCHSLVDVEFRDPWPAPIGMKRRIYRGFVDFARKCEKLRLRALGIESPEVWSNVMWARAKKRI